MNGGVIIEVLTTIMPNAKIGILSRRVTYTQMIGILADILIFISSYHK